MKILLLALAMCCWQVVLAQATKLPEKDNSKSIILGRTVEIYSKALAEKRQLNIYFPDGYRESDTTRYPAIYLLDGGTDEDFIHVVGLVQFNNFEWINRVPKSIVVGIVNTDRKRDFTYPTSITEDVKRYPTAGKSDRFMAFLKTDLQPYIEKMYRANQSKTIIGESLGGLLAAEILLKQPTLFNRYIIVSPSLWWDNGSLLNVKSEILNADFNAPLQVYIGVGKEGLTPTAIPRVMEVDANLLADKINGTKSKIVKVYFDYLPQEDHATVSHQAVFNAFRLLYAVKVK